MSANDFSGAGIAAPRHILQQNIEACMLCNVAGRGHLPAGVLWGSFQFVSDIKCLSCGLQGSRDRKWERSRRTGQSAVGDLVPEPYDFARILKKTQEKRNRVLKGSDLIYSQGVHSVRNGACLHDRAEDDQYGVF